MFDVPIIITVVESTFTIAHTNVTWLFLYVCSRDVKLEFFFKIETQIQKID